MTTPEERLQELRGYIDQADELIAQLLIARTEIIATVAELKRENWPSNCHLRPGREGCMHRAMTERFEGTLVSKRMALALWRQLIGGSTQIESPLSVTYLGNYPEHRFFAREYFGFQVATTKATTLLDAVDTIHRRQSNILVLPHPESSSWWQNIGSYSASNLRIFAAIPADAGILPSDCTSAVALADVTPEPSGDDISYFVTLDGALEIVDGFVTKRDGAIFIGAHPRPLVF